MRHGLISYRILLVGGALACLLQFAGSLKASDNGPSALPRREDVTYRMPGVDSLATHTLSWKVQQGPLPAYSDWYASVTPSAFLGGPIYTGLTWFWRETGLPGDIQFVGFATAARDTVIYTTPILWLPLDPVGTGSWSSSATNTAGEDYTFNFTYDGLDTLIVGTVANPETLSCWRVLLEQVLVTPSLPSAGASLRDGMGIERGASSYTKAAGTDTLWYETGALPRRRIAFRTQQPQSELLYLSHTMRETPVPAKQNGFGRLKARWGH